MPNGLSLDSLLDSISDVAEPAIEKAAADTSVSVADQLKDTLTKEASDASTIGEDNMSVQTGNAIADGILAMLDQGIEKAAANNVIEETSAMEVAHAARITDTPRQGKTVTEVAKALQAKEGGEKLDKVEGTAAATEGNSPSNVPAKASDIEKSAAVNELMAEGASFEEAVELVKQASAELEADADDLEKAAAVQALIGEGMAFDEAIEMVKQACEAEVEGEGYSDLEKSAAVNELIAEDGIEFDEAVRLVNAAAAE